MAVVSESAVAVISAATTNSKSIMKKPKKKRTRISDLLGNDNELLKPYSTVVLRAMSELRMLFAWKRELLLQVRHFSSKFRSDLKLNALSVRTDRIASKWKIVFANMIDLLEELAADINCKLECIRKFEKRALALNGANTCDSSPDGLTGPVSLFVSVSDEGMQATGLTPLEQVPNKSLQLIESFGRILLMMQSYAKHAAENGGDTSSRARNTGKSCVKSSNSTEQQSVDDSQERERRELKEAIGKVQAHVERVVAQKPVVDGNNTTSNTATAAAGGNSLVTREQERLRKTLTVIERNVARVFAQLRPSTSQPTSGRNAKPSSSFTTASVVKKSSKTAPKTTTSGNTGKSSWQCGGERSSGGGNARNRRLSNSGECISPVITPLSLSFASTPERPSADNVGGDICITRSGDQLIAGQLDKPTCTVWVSRNKLLNSLLGPVAPTTETTSSSEVMQQQQPSGEKPDNMPVIYTRISKNAAQTVMPTSSSLVVAAATTTDNKPRLCYISPSASVFAVKNVPSSAGDAGKQQQASITTQEQPITGFYLLPPTAESMPQQQLSTNVCPVNNNVANALSSSSMLQQFNLIDADEKPTFPQFNMQTTQQQQQNPGWQQLSYGHDYASATTFTEISTPCNYPMQPHPVRLDIIVSNDQYLSSMAQQQHDTSDFTTNTNHADQFFFGNNNFGDDFLLSDNLLGDDFLLSMATSSQHEDEEYFLKSSPFCPNTGGGAAEYESPSVFDSTLMNQTSILQQPQYNAPVVEGLNVLPPVSSLTGSNNNNIVPISQSEWRAEITTKSSGLQQSTHQHHHATISNNGRLVSSTKRSASTMAMPVGHHQTSSCHGIYNNNQRQYDDAEYDELKMFRSKSARVGGERYMSGGNNSEYSYNNGKYERTSEDTTPTPVSLAFSSVQQQQQQNTGSNAGSPAVSTSFQSNAYNNNSEASPLLLHNTQQQQVGTTTAIYTTQQVNYSTNHMQHHDNTNVGGWKSAADQQYQHCYSPAQRHITSINTTPRKAHHIHHLSSSSSSAAAAEEAVNNFGGVRGDDNSDVGRLTQQFYSNYQQQLGTTQYQVVECSAEQHQNQDLTMLSDYVTAPHPFCSDTAAAASSSEKTTTNYAYTNIGGGYTTVPTAVPPVICSSRSGGGYSNDENTTSIFSRASSNVDATWTTS